MSARPRTIESNERRTTERQGNNNKFIRGHIFFYVFFGSHFVKSHPSQITREPVGTAFLPIRGDVTGDGSTISNPRSCAKHAATWLSSRRRSGFIAGTLDGAAGAGRVPILFVPDLCRRAPPPAAVTGGGCCLGAPFMGDAGRGALRATGAGMMYSSEGRSFGGGTVGTGGRRDGAGSGSRAKVEKKELTDARSLAWSFVYLSTVSELSNCRNEGSSSLSKSLSVV
jgi:hypothetical protein